MSMFKQYKMVHIHGQGIQQHLFNKKNNTKPFVYEKHHVHFSALGTLVKMRYISVPI